MSNDGDMAESATTGQSTEPTNGAETSAKNPFQKFLAATELDTRMLGMVAALLLVWCIFDIWSGVMRPNTGLFGGSFLTPRNLWTLLVQTSSIAVMATGMVLVIVMRHIDLSVGSMLSLVAVTIGVLQVSILGPALGVGNPSIWIIAVVAAIALGTLIGALNGYLIAYAQIPAFIVTLGGLIAFSGIAFLVSDGVTIAPMDKTFKIMGGSVSQGWFGPGLSWTLAVIGCVILAVSILNGRRQRLRFNFPLRPIWAEVTLAVGGSVVILGITAVLNSYPWPFGVIKQYAEANGLDIPAGVADRAGAAICMEGEKIVRCADGLMKQTGYALPVIIAIAIGIVMTFVSTRTRFGRYVYAVGGNPEAAELAGINTKALTVKVFALMGALVAVSAIISSARLDAATIALGTLSELYVIAAAVIGGTSLAGGVGTIYGAMIGALMMQSIQSGMALLNLPAAYQNIVVGGVLVLAVWLDQIYRRRVN
ncbi:MAG: sugar ABC transporter permease [Marinosulfonomonas sp.]